MSSFAFILPKMNLTSSCRREIFQLKDKNIKVQPNTAVNLSLKLFFQRQIF